MIIVWLARMLDHLSRRCERWSTALYRAHNGHEARKAQREVELRHAERARRDAIAINDLIAGSRSKHHHAHGDDP